MPDPDSGAYQRATAPLERLTDAYGRAGVALVDAHWQAVETVVLEAEDKAAAIRVTPRAAIVGGRARLLFDIAVILPDGSPVPLAPNERLSEHLRAIHAVAGMDEFEDDRHIDRKESDRGQ